MVSTHIGFVPPPSDPGYQKIVDRTKIVAADFAARGVNLLMETGPKPAGEMRGRSSVPSAHTILYVNFDPANMILYGAGDPIDALNILSPHIRHVHLKDAIASAKPGVEWGSEVPFGSGQVGAAGFFRDDKESWLHRAVGDRTRSWRRPHGGRAASDQDLLRGAVHMSCQSADGAANSSTGVITPSGIWMSATPFQLAQSHIGYKPQTQVRRETAPGTR